MLDDNKKLAIFAVGAAKKALALGLDDNVDGTAEYLTRLSRLITSSCYALADGDSAKANELLDKLTEISKKDFEILDADPEAQMLRKILDATRERHG